jgi:sirohydrochlorin cobaltochelatase
MIVAGDHANNDMAGDEAGSWKTEFKRAGYDVECVIEGLGEIPGIQDMFVKKTAEAIAKL